MSKRIYTPFFYIIKDKITKKYYAGYNTTSDHTLFMTPKGYTTSSTYVNMILEQHDYSRFEIIKIKLFESKEKAYDYETRFLRKVDAANNNKFLNMHNNIGNSPCFGTKEFEELMLSKYGVKNCMHIPEVAQKISDQWTDDKKKALSEKMNTLWQDQEFITKRRESLKAYMETLSEEDKKTIYGTSSRGIKRDSTNYIIGAEKRCSDPNFSSRLSAACTGIARKERPKTQCKICGNLITFQNIKRHIKGCN